MIISEVFLKKLQHAVYNWIGSISVLELASNKELQQGISLLFRQLEISAARSGRGRRYAIH